MSAIRVAARRRAALVAVAVAASLVGTGAPPGAAAEEEIRIIRDEFGVPHIFAPTDEGVSYGAGYALAQDRLWQMIVFKHIAKGRLSDILGPIVVDIDKEIRFFTYTEDERAARFETYPKDIRQNLQAFADGINARLAEVRTDPALVPFELTQLNEEDELAEDWTVDDSVALGDVLILAFGSGGGNELAYAGLLAELTETLGKRPGRKAFNDLIMRVDPDSPVSIPRNLDYKHSSTFARGADANKRRGLTADARLSLEPSEEQQARAPRAAKGTMQQLGLIPDIDAALEGYDALERGRRLLRRMFTFGSNAQIAGPSMSEEGNTIQTGGPQVGYLLSQWLVDFGLHGDKLNATGMTFAGAGPAVLIGRGNGFAWTTTTGASDLTDTYVEELNPDDPNQYKYNGEFEDMECRTETYTFRGAPFEQQEICRTRHGPVLSVDEDNNVAYSVRYAWFNREGQTVEGFFRYNEAESVEDFATFANFLSSNHNMFYTDDQGNFGYWHPGNHVRRAKGIDIRLPQDGTGGSEWRGLLPIKKVPHAVNFDRGWLANWNNQPAKNWKRERGHPALDNVLDLEDALDPGGRPRADPILEVAINPDGLLDFEDANANLRYAAFKHHRHTYFKEYLPELDQLPLEELYRAARKTVGAWYGFLNDSDEDGMVDSAGKTILDRWVRHMQTLAFEDDLGELTCWEENSCFTNESLLWHLLNTNDRAQLGHDWLGELSAEELAAQAFVSAVDELAAENENEDPKTWKEEVALEHYQRLNADLAADTAETEMGNGEDDSGRPGDVADHIAMDRGTYNHIVAYLTPPKGNVLGKAKSMAGSVIPPGQSGFINQLGEEDPHYETQLQLYIDWTYKPMPMTLEEALAVATSDETITRPTD